MASTMPMRTVLIVEDDALMRDMLATVIEVAGFQVSTASNGMEALNACREIDPDALIVDIDLGRGVNGVQVAEAAVREIPGLAVVFLTNLPDARFCSTPSANVLENAAYLRKTRLGNGRELVQAINLALTEKITKEQRHDKVGPDDLSILNFSQLEILRMLSEGMSNEQIALNLGISSRSVERTIAKIGNLLLVDQNAGNTRVKLARRYLLATR